MAFCGSLAFVVKAGLQAIQDGEQAHNSVGDC